MDGSCTRKKDGTITIATIPSHIFNTIFFFKMFDYYRMEGVYFYIELIHTYKPTCNTMNTILYKFILDLNLQ